MISSRARDLLLITSLVAASTMGIQLKDQFVPYVPTEYWFTTSLDHYSKGGNSSTFNIRYLVNGQYWDPQTGPILFYAGNEGDVWGFYNNSGFMTETIAKETKGLIVFGEHRYFGKSFPVNKSDAFNQTNSVYLTIHQTMMDYVELIKKVRYDYGINTSPCIVFGGSYGGMLAAWLRMKFPFVFQGALAASAPILYFKDSPTAPEPAFNDIITQSYVNQSAKCNSTIREAWDILMNIKNTRPTDFGALSTALKTCDPITKTSDIDNLYNHLMNGYAYMAMTNYPYKSSFLEPMPAWPVQEACYAVGNVTIRPATPPTPTTWETMTGLFSGLFQESEEQVEVEDGNLGALSNHESDVLLAILNSVNVYYNYSGQAPCTNFSDVDGTGQLDGKGWDYLACNQIPMPTSIGSNAIFLPSPFDYDAYTKQCYATYNTTPQYSFVFDYFGGQDLHHDLAHVSNIIFSNGELDPWRAGGVNENLSNWDTNRTVALFIAQSAHHLDLRLPNAQDPASVTQARQIEMSIIKRWISDWWGTSAQE